MMLEQIKKDLQQVSDSDHAKRLSGFFKTGKGQYGEGDFFLGITVPKQRAIAKKYQNLGLNEIQELLRSKFHEHRFTALIILVSKYKNAKKSGKDEIYNFLLKNMGSINNWDLVDWCAPRIIGDYLIDKDRSILHELAKSNNLWERRISILATFKFIANNDFGDSLSISETLLDDNHDLIHKGVGWALREIGKRNQELEEQFLRKHSSKIPRTMLRYAIEKFNEKKRKFYLTKK